MHGERSGRQGLRQSWRSTIPRNGCSPHHGSTLSPAAPPALATTTPTRLNYGRRPTTGRRSAFNLPKSHSLSNRSRPIPSALQIRSIARSSGITASAGL